MPYCTITNGSLQLAHSPRYSDCGETLVAESRQTPCSGEVSYARSKNWQALDFVAQQFGDQFWVVLLAQVSNLLGGHASAL